MRVFVVLGLVFSIPGQEIGLGKRLRNDLFYVVLDAKPQLNQSVNAVLLGLSPETKTTTPTTTTTTTTTMPPSTIPPRESNNNFYDNNKHICIAP